MFVWQIVDPIELVATLQAMSTELPLDVWGTCNAEDRVSLLAAVGDEITITCSRTVPTLANVPAAWMVCATKQNCKTNMRDPGIEPGSVPWQGTILPLNQPRRKHVS